ncbi:hypothetical protein [Winogradskyella sp.]|uniref:hypothetical protein n=1 Tax=Winogradskyella sp. TaxID=1883156 RepID=UPI00260302EA|nr:hypothetical protein [Winogradskyella sp.]
MKALLFFKVVLFLVAMIYAYIMNLLIVSPINGFIQQHSILVSIIIIVLAVGYYLFRIEHYNRNKYKYYYNS